MTVTATEPSGFAFYLAYIFFSHLNASVSNGKRHVVKRKQTREKACGLCLNANSCNMQNQNKYFGNSQSFPPLFQLNFRHCICVAIFIILQLQSEKL